MPQEVPPGDPVPPQDATVVQWGDDGDDGSGPRRRLAGLPRSAARTLGDRWLVPSAAVLGGVALFLSLIFEWQVTTIDGAFFGEGELNRGPFPAGVSELNGWSGGYLSGIFLLVAAMVLLLFGPPAARSSARLVVLSTGGTLLAVLVALMTQLADSSRLFFGLQAGMSDNQLQITYGRGVWCALAGVAALTLAAYLAGRLLPADGPVPAAPPLPGVVPDARTDDWPWRRPHPAAEPDEPVEGAPLDLTVSASPPFTPPRDGDDRRQ